MVVLAPADVLGNVGQNSIAFRLHRILGGTEHALRDGIVRRELLLPIGEAGPRRCLKEMVGGRWKGIRVDQGSTADTHTVQHRDVVHERHLKNALEPHRRHPHPFL